jgi:putative intracellular protease/amidase
MLGTLKPFSSLVVMDVLFSSAFITCGARLTRATAMFDLATDPTSHKLINEFYTYNKIVAAVCHGPAALTHVKLASGEYLLDGQPVTGFSNTEEDQVGLTSAVPFSLEDALNQATGGKFVKASEPWGPKVVVARGGRLITGQNPASAAGVGQAIYDAIFGELTTKDEI